MLKKSGKIFHRQSPDLQQVFHRGEGRILAWLWGLRTFPQFQHPLLLLYSYNKNKCIGYITVKPLLRRADLRFAEPRKKAFRKESVKGGLPLKECRRKAEKGFNWIVRGFVFGVLNRGLQNLGASLKRF